ncbi:MAG: hypothetical protein AB1546_05895 [bacterium]
MDRVAIYPIVISVFFTIASFLPLMGFNFFYLDDQIFYHETLYALGYDEWQFIKIRNGTSIGEIKKMLGEPLCVYRNDDGSFDWRYTVQGPQGTNYIMRNLKIGKNKKVRGKEAYYYVD